ncbi:heterokaryon incompatibility protein-domain-containing protein [Sordaria brevicollis]|uniref:Heterokaryon incompatibility protein-domain-containing protein n=1 Tax=Sordaria brevicollis TaxID=83679 RepID=A0AAE0PFT6_SORBR|nr:heterokaryon incompatibility protein-domain-containing protein [Sordaria brevicollis]
MQSGELSCSPSSDQAYDFVRARLRDCDVNHPGCKSDSAELPTRMIDVGGFDDYVRLVETSSLPQSSSINYIALSYCWGIGQSVTTVSSNYEEFTTKGISVSTLPPTLRDAVTVARELGQRYIWIDALCIIQDSSSDWELEAARMASVYQNAYLTISAGTAAAAAEGFLEGRQHMAAREKNVYTTEWSASDNTNVETTLAARIIPSSVNHWKYMVNHGLPLNTRGWTMQEKILSRRVITYSTHELQWTCLSLNTCECGYLLDSNKRGHNTISINPDLSRREASYQWAKIIAEYSSRCLTYVEDKLPAISGVAHALQPIFRSAYLAGHWVDNLPEELAWKAMPPHPEYNPPSSSLSSSSSETTKQYIAPTFSWASIRGGSVECVYLNHDIERRWTSCCVVSGFHSEVKGQNPLGRISDASITLRGYLLGGQLTIKKFHGFYTVESVTLPGEKKVHFFMDTFLEELSFVGPDGTKERSVRRSPTHLSLPGPKTERGIDCPVYLFLLGYWIGEGNDDEMESKPEPDMAFLVLGRAPNQVGKWERVGFGRCQRQLRGRVSWQVRVRKRERRG